MPVESKGFITTVDRIKLKLTKSGNHFVMEPIDLPGPKPAEFNPPLVTIGDTDVTYDAGPTVVRWKMDQIFDLPQDWNSAERINGKGPLTKMLISIQRRDGTFQITISGPKGRPETWDFQPF